MVVYILPKIILQTSIAFLQQNSEFLIVVGDNFFEGIPFSYLGHHIPENQLGLFRHVVEIRCLRLFCAKCYPY
jgi:hypothetical protein